MGGLFEARRTDATVRHDRERQRHDLSGWPSKIIGITRCAGHLLLAAGLMGISLPQCAAETVAIGVLAFRPKPQSQMQWQPLASVLKRAMPEHEFVVEALDYPELEAAVAAHRIHFVLTNPSHYVLLSYRLGLSAPLATLIVDDDGKPLSAFGGVIIARSGRNDINTLSDLRGRTVAAVGAESLGGYQMQVYELARAGIRLPRDAELLPTGMPHDRTVAAVLEGKADAGFVRTGLLESMAREGKLDLGQVKVLNRQNPPDFPLRLSTRLYPEWPFAALPHSNDQIARRVAATLFLLEEDRDVIRSLNIHGFTVPADYNPVVDLMRDLRLPPFEAAPDFTLHDVWARYRWEILAAIAAGMMILLLGFSLVLANRRLREERHRHALETRLRHELLYALGEGVYGVNHRGHCIFINPAALRMLDFTEDEVMGRDQHALFHHHKPDGSPYPEHECPIFQSLQDGVSRRKEEWFWRKDGTSFPVAITVSPIHEDGTLDGAVVVFRDITEEKAARERDHLLVSALEAVGNGVVITDTDARIKWANTAFESLTGYRRAEAVGRKPSDLVKSGRQGKPFYQAMWQTILAGDIWRGEVVNRRKDGSLYDEELTIAPVKDENGVIRHFVGIKQDISERKQIEEHIRHMAQYDILTDLPNRALLSDRLQLAIAGAKRDATGIALMFIDLDKFKPINDTFGHDIGDILLKEVATRIQGCVRASDTVARVGGDEFVVMLRTIEHDPNALTVAEKIRRALNRPFMLAGQQLNISSSTGIALYPEHGDNETELSKCADIAMYQAKKNGRNNVQIFHPSMETPAS